jgi:hypothetical protein
VKRLYDLEIDEISLVDRPANQHGLVAIAKRAEEGAMPVYDAEGYEVDETSLEVGDVVYDGDGVEHVMLDPETAAELGYGEYEAEPEDDGSYEVDSYDAEPELAGVGKAGMTIGFRSEAGRVGAKQYSSARRAYGGFKEGMKGNKSRVKEKSFAAGNKAGNKLRDNRGKGGLLVGAGAGYEASKSLGDQVLEELSKALDNNDRDEVISKLGDMVAEAREESSQAWAIAKRLLDERDTNQYIELASQYDLPVNPDHLGRVLKRASEVLPDADLALLDRVLTSAGAATYDEIGYNGYSSSDVMSQVYGMANEAVTKSDLTSEQAIVALFEANPQAYDEYLSESR